MDFGKKIMWYQTDRRAMFFHDQIKPILMGIGFILFAITVLLLDTELTNNFVYAVPFLPFFMIAGGGYIVFHAFWWIQAMDLVVYENGFSFTIGKRKGVARYLDVLEMGYGEVTYRGKVTENIRLYVAFNNGEKNVYLPYITKEKDGYWAEISECLANAYVKHTGRDLTIGEHIPM